MSLTNTLVTTESHNFFGKIKIQGFVKPKLLELIEWNGVLLEQLRIYLTHLIIKKLFCT